MLRIKPSREYTFINVSDELVEDSMVRLLSHLSQSPVRVKGCADVGILPIIFNGNRLRFPNVIIGCEFRCTVKLEFRNQDLHDASASSVMPTVAT